MSVAEPGRVAERLARHALVHPKLGVQIAGRRGGSGGLRVRVEPLAGRGAFLLELGFERGHLVGSGLLAHGPTREHAGWHKAQ